MVAPGACHATVIIGEPAKSGGAATGSGVCTAFSRASHASTRRSADSQLLSSWAAMRRLSGSQSSVAPLRQRGFIPGLLQLEFDDALLFTASFHVPASGLCCRLDRHRLDRAEQLLGDRGVDATAEREAPGQPKHQVGAIAAVDGLSW